MEDSTGRMRQNAGWALAIGTMVLAALVLRKAFASADAVPGQLPLWSLALGGIWLLGGIGVHLLATHRPHRSQRTAGRDLLESTALGLGFAAASFAGGWVLLQIPVTAPWVSDALLAVAGGSALLVFAVALVTGAAEEVFFRLGLSDLCARVWRWVIPTALYTLVTAASGNPGLTLVAPLLGLAATAARERTGRWWAPLLVHALWSVAMIGVFPLTAA